MMKQELVNKKQDFITSKYPLLARRLCFELDCPSQVADFNRTVNSFFEDLAVSLYITGDPELDTSRMLTVHEQFPDLENFFVVISCDKQKYNSIVSGFFAMLSEECSLL